jgi:DNA transposition AAA+ family ATPase
MKYICNDLEVIVPVRFQKNQLKLIKKIVSADKDITYESISHFIRASCIRRMREDVKRLKLWDEVKRLKLW